VLRGSAMAGHGEKRERLTEAAVAALLQHGTVKAAAGAVGVDESTLRSWLRGPAFLAAYREARRQVVEHAVGALQAFAGSAVVALTRNLECGKPADEIRAATALLDLALRGVELGDLAQQVAELKAEVEAVRHDQRGAHAGGGEAAGPAQGDPAGG